MAELSPLIKDLALILMVAGVVTLVFKKLKQPLVLGYIMAGFLVSPHMPYTASVADLDDIHTWADIGVMFLLFSLGLDFSFKKIVRMGASPVITTCSIVFCMMLLGVVAGKLFGWQQMDCIFLGGMLAMSSTTIIYKAFDDLGLRQQQFSQKVMSVLILEDILAIVMMVMLSAIAVGSADSGQMLGSVAKIVFFLVLWFVVGIFAIPLLLKSVRRLMNQEVLLIVALGLCCGMAVFSTQVGFSSAFGAFVMGSILAETVEAEKIIRLVEPVKNLFGAVFFVSVGMLVDPQILADYAWPIALLVLTILVGQATLGSASFMLGGETLRSALRCGFSMAQIGEFSFIIASLGLSLGVISQYLYPVVVAVSVITTFLTPYMIRAAVPAYKQLERHLPGHVIEQLNHLTTSHQGHDGGNLWHKLLMAMGLNTLIYSILSSATIFLMFTFALPLTRRLLPGWELHWYANAITGVLTVVLIAPFLRAMVVKKNHSSEWKQLWAESSRNHLPLLFTVLVRMTIAVAFIFYICNYLTRFTPALMLTIGVIAIVLMVLSRQVKNRSILLERMFKQNLRSRDIEAQVHGKKRPLFEGRLLDRNIHIADVDVPEGSLWAGQTLRSLDLGRRYGVHVSSILRGGRRMNIPDGEKVIYPADRLQVIGTDEQLARLQQVLQREVLGEDPDLERREMLLRSIALREGHPFVGKTMQESGIRDRYGCMVVGLEEGKEQLSMVSPKYRFRQGDVVWIVGERDNLSRIEKSQ